MKRNIDPNDIHSAIDTWSGFIYQGKIALLHVLRLINSKSCTTDNCLQLDSIEDFAIVDNETDLNPITIHQVKAMKSTLYSSYSIAFNKLEKRLRDFPCTGAFFHLAMDNEKTSTEIKTLHPNLSIYEYDGGFSSCSLENVNSWIEFQITQYLNSNSLSHHCGNEGILSNHLEAEIFNQVISIHANNHERDGLSISQGAYYFVIPFSRFVNILETSPTALLGINYYLVITKELLNSYYTEFCLEQENLPESSIGDSIKSKLDQYLQQINSLNTTQLLEFLRKLIPDRQFRLGTLKDFVENNVSKDGFKDSFIQCLFDLRMSDTSITNGLTWLDLDSKRYTATAILSNQNNLNKTCLRIHQNIMDTDFEVPYQCDCLITSGLENRSMKETLNSHFDIDKINDEDEIKKNNITKWSMISLIDIRTAKSKLT
jgi:hypothetical protein